PVATPQLPTSWWTGQGGFVAIPQCESPKLHRARVVGLLPLRRVSPDSFMSSRTRSIKSISRTTSGGRVKVSASRRLHTANHNGDSKNAAALWALQATKSRTAFLLSASEDFPERYVLAVFAPRCMSCLAWNTTANANPIQGLPVFHSFGARSIA